MKRYIIAALIVIACSAGGLRADDTEIYGVINNTSVAPNVLIIFDTSGSMADPIPGEPYDPATTYPGSFSANAVYERYWDGNEHQWSLLTSNVNNITCAAIKSNLLAEGYATGKLRASFACGGTKRWLRLGNFSNYDASGIGLDRRKIDVAKTIVDDLIRNTDGVRFGMMVYNYNSTDSNSGGRLVAPCADRPDLAAKQPLLDVVANASPNGWTPLAETLAEAGLYFAGKPSWFNSSGFPSGTYTGGHYVSPMEYRCQKNYVILMTDGLPTMDRHPKLYDTAYINNDYIGDQDGDHAAPCAGFSALEYWYRDDDGNCQYHPQEGSDYLDDVAKYLYSNDCNPDLGSGTSFAKQNIVTYTIGFALTDATKLLYRTAVNGGGEYFTAKNYSALKEAFKQIMSAIVEKNSCFVAPVVPVSRMNRTYAGNKIYLGFFKPQQEGNWYGNIKRYKLEDNGAIKDSKGQVATSSEGMIKDEARSWWTTLGDDGPAVEKGGAAERLEALIGQNARNVYTYTGSQALLTDASNAFVTGNTAITNSMLDPYGQWILAPADRDKLFDIVRKDSFGDVIHSEPAVVFYSNGADGFPDTADDDVKIFVGTNDGQLHCIDDATGNEVWSFVPPDQLGRLSLLNDSSPDHDYFVDGSPTVYYSSSQKILVIGSRRGGKSYTALDITNYNAPSYLYSIGPDALGPTPTAYERLGQSWSRPEKATVATGYSASTSVCGVALTVNTADVFLFAGGYDNDNQDLDAPSASDEIGRAVFAANMTNGTLINNLKFTPATHPSLGMTHSVVDVAGFDHDGDGIVSRIYFGDLGGNIFALKDDQVQTFTVPGCPPIAKSVVDGVWSGMKLFQAPEFNGKKLKILYAPDAVAEKYPPSAHGEYIYFGTGDREDPGNTAVENRFYAIKNDWTATSPLTESSLVDVTSDLIQLGTAAQKQQVQTNLDNAKGWYIRLGNLGEKVVSSPRVYAGVVYFTTYAPAASGGPADPDPCAASTASGVARLYALNYKNGASVTNFNASGETNTSGNPFDGLGKLDRSKIVGTAIPSAPVIAILAGGARIFIGVEGGLVSLPAVASQDMIRYYWNQIF